MKQTFYRMVKKILLILPLRFTEYINSYNHKRYIQRIFSEKRLGNLRREILEYYSNFPQDKISRELSEPIDFLKHNPLTYFPCNLSSKYCAENVQLFFDQGIGLNFALIDGKRLYFKRGWTESECIQYCYCIQAEQDKNSPHRYLSEQFTVQTNDIVVDVGAAEGIFSLDVIEKAIRVYLFESDRGWIEALEATFVPWKEKVIIVDSFVSDKDDQTNITLDTFFQNREHPAFLKVDVDGAEAKLLKGCMHLLAVHKPMKIALCTYHKQEDESMFSKLLREEGFNISYSKGYMLFINDELKPPYFRRGVLRAVKSNRV